MAKMKPEQIRNMSDAELEQTIINLKEGLYKLRVESKSGRVEKPHLLREARRNIARCYTVMKEKKSGRTQ